MKKLDVERLRAKLEEDAPARAAPALSVVAFLARYLPFRLSLAWRVLVSVAWGIALTLDDEREMLATVCGFAEPGRSAYAEVLVVAGRRSGKSAVIAALGVYVACVEGPAHMAFLSPGQRGYVTIISRSVRQALECFRYARAMVERNDELLALLDGEPLESLYGGELRFKSGVVLTVMPASKASVRGYTIIWSATDEGAWLAVDAESANQDEEIESAIRFAMIAPTGAPMRRKIIISSPAAKSGVVYETFHQYHGDPKAPVLVAHGPTWLWNPSIDRAALETEKARDPKRYAREVLAEFVDAISAWCDGDVINQSAVGRTVEALAPRAGVRYAGGCDIGLKRDSSSLAIGHREPVDASAADRTPRFVVDGVWRWTPTPGVPLDARRVVREMAAICRRYGVRKLLGDQFAAIPLAVMFQDEGLSLVEETATNRSKLEHYTALRELFYAGKVSLPAVDVLLRELRELQERVTSQGNVQIGHPNRATAHDDAASAVAWLLAGCARTRPAAFGTYDALPASLHQRMCRCGECRASDSAITASGLHITEGQNPWRNR